MAAEKRLFWLQLKNTYFNQLSQKKMRKQPQGLEMQVIYLRMMLLSLDNKGYIFYQGVYDSIEEELSEEFNEPLELVKQTIDFLIENKMVTTDQEDDSLFIPEALECTISEGASAERMRRKRARDKLSQSDGSVTESDGNVTESDTYKNKNKVREEKELDNTLFNSLTLKEGDTLPPSAGAGGASPFTLIDCQECADEGKVNLSEDGIMAFYNRMQKDGWRIKGKPVENLLKAMRGFAKNHKRYQKKVADPEPEIYEPEPVTEKEEENKISTEKEPDPKTVLISNILKKTEPYIPKEKLNSDWYLFLNLYCDKNLFTPEELELLQQDLGLFKEECTISEM